MTLLKRIESIFKTPRIKNKEKYKALLAQKLINLRVKPPRVKGRLPSVDEVIKYGLEKLNKLKKDKENSISKRIRDFQRSKKKSLTLSNLTDKDRRIIIQTLIPKEDRYTTIEANGKFITLTNDNMEHLFRSLEYEESYQKDSFDVFITDYYKVKEITIFQELKQRYQISREMTRFVKNNRQYGAFFPYLNKTKINLTKYAIFSEIDPKNYKDNCLVYAIKESNLFSTEEINNITSIVKNRNIPIKDLKIVAKELNCMIKLKHNDRIIKYGEGKVLNIGLIKKHYFLNDKTRYTKYSIKNYNELNEISNFGSLYMKNKYSNKRFIDSYDAIKLMVELDMFDKLTLTTENITKTQYYTEVDQQITTLNYLDSNTKAVKSSDPKKVGNLYFADFETCTDGQHEAYLCITIDEYDRKRIFRGKLCGLNLLKSLPDKSVVYFHNLGYDSSFFIKYLNVTKIIQTGSMIKLINGIFNKKQLFFKDSYAIIPKKLSEFPKMFDLSIKKEIMPYELYNKVNVTYDTVKIEEALKYVDKKEEFLKLAEPYIKGDDFDHMKYAEFYCEQDCRVLQKGVIKFYEWMKEEFKIDVTCYVSLPGLAYAYCEKQGCLNGVYELSGVPRMFIQKCVVGGRVMLRDNEKQYIEDEISDFDAVSLYPSAMARMGFLKGKPKILTKEQCNLDFLNSVDGYFVKINNIKINKNLHFPLRSNEGQIKNYSNELTTQYIDKVSLEDLIKFQKAEFDIVEGYYFDDGRNYKIQKVIRYLFEQRIKYKKEKNPVQEVYKLLMNAIYGKMIQKEHKTDLKFKNSEEEHKKFFRYNYNFIKSYNKIGEDKYCYTMQKTINKHFNLVHVGTEILAMSKRIMNEVMCLAEDLDISIYYQDTDSMHIKDKDITKLSEEYKKIYNRELIGQDMGQFHSDFKDGEKSKLFIGLGKKSYIDDLGGHYHMRMKGIPSKCIEHEGNPIEIYKFLYNCGQMTFDLSKGLTLFKRDKNFNVNTIDMKRTVKFDQGEKDYSIFIYDLPQISP